MDKIPTMFVRDPANMKLVTREVTPGCEWVLADEGLPTVKRDGMNVCAVIKGGVRVEFLKRRNPSRAEKEAGAEPGYVPANRDDPAGKYLFVALDATNLVGLPDGAHPCEALGAKIQGGVEGASYRLYFFGQRPEPIGDGHDLGSFDGIRDFLAGAAIEGIVFHHPDGRMAKIKRRDFGLPWPFVP